MATNYGLAAGVFLIYATGNVCFEFHLFSMVNCSIESKIKMWDWNIEYFLPLWDAGVASQS